MKLYKHSTKKGMINPILGALINVLHTPYILYDITYFNSLINILYSLINHMSQPIDQHIIFIDQLGRHIKQYKVCMQLINNIACSWDGGG